MIPMRRQPLQNFHSLLTIFLLANGILPSSPIFINTASLYAQEAHREFKFEHLGVEQGLSQCTISAIHQDRRGFLWIGTQDGLNRYDGYSFVHYKHNPDDTTSISHNRIVGLTEDQSGRLWVCTGAGLNQFDPASGDFTKHPRRQNLPSLMPNGTDLLLAGSDGIIWIGASNGLLSYDPATDNLIHYQTDPKNPGSLRSNTITGKLEDDAGTLWILTNISLERFDRERGAFEHFQIPLKQDYLKILSEDRFGTLWIGTGRSGIWSFDRRRKVFTRSYRHIPGDSTSLLDNEIYSIGEDVTGALWVGTRKGIHRFDRTSGRFTRLFHNPQDAASTGLGLCTQIYSDRSGVLWFGIDGSGLSKLDPRPPTFAHLKHQPGNPNSLCKDLCKAIYEDRFGDLWIGTVWSGLDRVDRRTGKVTHYRHDPADPWTVSGSFVSAIYEDRQEVLWIGTDHGLNRFDRERNRFANYRNDAGRKVGLPSEMVQVITQDKAGVLWLGGGIGLTKYSPELGEAIWLRPELDTIEKSRDVPVTAIHEDRKGRLWIGTTYGFVRFDRDEKKFFQYVHSSADSNSIGDNYVKTIWEDKDGILWIGTTDGLNRFDPETGKFTRYHEKDGLPNSFIYGILGDDHDNLWISTNKGLSRMTLSTADGSTTTTIKFRNYELQDGVQSYEFNTGAYHRSKRTGEMFFGGVNGINIFHPDSVKDDSYIPPIVITDFKKFDEPAKLPGELTELKEIKLKHEEDVFSFEFAALDFTQPEKNQYAHMLEGFDKDWVYSGTRRHARYTNLDPGRYTFRVKGTNHDGVWNEPGTSISIHIIPPFWMRWWFRISATILALAVFGGVVKTISSAKLKRRLRELERQHALQRERERISKDMHDEIGSGLTMVAILSELAQRDRVCPDKLENHLQKISETAHELVDSISEIIWAINPRNNALDNLAAYLRRYAAQYFELTPMRCRLDFPEAVPDYPLPAEFRRHIFLVAKEAIHNVVKHSKATAVEMKLISYDHTLEIVIKDNGRGFCPETVNGGGNGLTNMKKRIDEIGGNFEILSQPNAGTTVRIFAKIKTC